MNFINNKYLREGIYVFIIIFLLINNYLHLEEDVHKEEHAGIDDIYDDVDEYYLNNPKFESCAYDTVRNCQSELVYERLYIEENIEICNDFIDERQKESCKEEFIIHLAVSSADERICSELEDITKKDVCFEKAVIEKGIVDRDFEQCEKLDHLRHDFCIEVIADVIISESHNDESCYLENSDALEIQECLEHRKEEREELELCEQYEHEEHDECIINTIQSFHD